MKNSVEIHRNGIIFSTEYATELLGVISILCEDQDAICDAGAEYGNREYRNEVLSYFSSWKGTEITQLLERLSDDYNFNYDAPVDLFLQLKHQVQPDLDALCRHRKPVTPALVDHFLELVRQFEANSNFAGFYDAHRGYYERSLQRFIADYDVSCPLDFLGRFADMLGEKRNHINLMFGITNSNYAVTVGKDIYANLCPNSRSRYAPMPDFSRSPIYWTTLIVHEFAHAFVNPMVAGYSSSIEEMDIAPYRDILKKMMYGDSLETYIIETIIRAIECLYVGIHFPASYEEFVREYEDEGFRNIRSTEKLLDGFALETCMDAILELFA